MFVFIIINITKLELLQHEGLCFVPIFFYFYFYLPPVLVRPILECIDERRHYHRVQQAVPGAEYAFCKKRSL